MLFYDLFKIIKSNENQLFQIKLSDKNHPVFKAHFPKNPILPGFIQIDISQYLFKLDIKKIKKAKFLQIIKPNEILDIELQKEKKKIILFRDEKKVSEFIYE